MGVHRSDFIVELGEGRKIRRTAGRVKAFMLAPVPQRTDRIEAMASLRSVSCTLALDGKLYAFDGDSLLPLVPPQKNQCSFRVYNSLTDNAMEPAIVSRTMCTELQRAEQEVACRFLLPTSAATKHRSRISVASFLSVLPRNLPSCAGSRMVSMF